ncbi:MAG: 50S ribosomal protein L25 [Deltaproteobacteria bacterium]|nr:MAG: 50S ribosomal protein L25 [Deltaproteobacteria bacterium]
MALPELSARIRQQVGKGPSRALRRAGMVPAILHQSPQEPVLLKIKAHDLSRQSLGKLNSKVRLKIETPEGNRDVLARVQEVQRHPFRDYLLHLDFISLESASGPARDIS